MIKRENDHLGGRESARADRSAARAPLAATGSRTRSLVYVALCIAVMAASAWVAIPIGPVPITLQIFAVVFALQILTPKQLMCALAGYLLLGAIGIPVFSGMRGGFGVLLGPTGGFLWGYLVAGAVSSNLLALARRHGLGGFAASIVAGLLFTAIAYACGCVQYMIVAHVGLLPALAVTVAPFVIIDIVKVAIATVVARAVTHAVGSKAVYRGNERA